MKIKVTFSTIVDADSIEEAYNKIIGELKQGTQELITHERTYHSHLSDASISMRTHGVNYFTFERLKTHTGYGEGSVDYDY